MSQYFLTGRVVRTTDLAALGGIVVRLHGPTTAFLGVPNAQPQPAGYSITWTRQLSGFAGTRWDCWVKNVQNQVNGITWEQFCDGALLHNPSLNPEHIFRADQTYLLPEASAAQPYTWSRQLSGFAGTRWDCWVKNVQNQVNGITWQQFCDNALSYNPQLNADGRLFKVEKSYLLPQNDTTPRSYLEATTDAQGNYAFTLGATAAIFELQIEVDDFARFVLPLVVNGAVSQPVTLSPQTAAASPTLTQSPAPPAAPASGRLGMSGNIRSARADYNQLPEKARRVIDNALFMLGDDARVFDALPPQLQSMCYGSRFLNNPNDFHYKDIVCADLVSVVFASAGLDIKWGGGANPSMADYYVPDGNAKLIEITNPSDWLPGDVLVYGPAGSPGRKAGHVDLFVGLFTGTDRNGQTYSLADNVEVVDASMDFMSNGREVGTGIQGRTVRPYCIDKKCYTYQWVRRVRLRELAAAFGK